jgi:membrane-associated protease RseP (regulator of RpoE activity)
VKLAAIILGFALTSSLFAGDAGSDEAIASQPAHGVGDVPWLGFTVGHLDDAVRAHVPDLPQGIGFVLTKVAAGSPAEKAGVKAYDVFWKFGDQLIANEAQLLTLLRLKKDGDEVEIGLYRSGESLTIPVVLARQQEEQVLGHLPIKPAGISPDTPMKVLNPAGRNAAIDTPDGRAVLTLINGRTEVRIVSKAGSVIFEGPTKDAQGVSLVPDPWKPRVGALERALAHAVTGSRPPRMRVLPSGPAAEEK